MSHASSARPKLAVAIVAPSLSILGGQAVQARRLLDAWKDDPDVHAWLVPINPAPPAWLRPVARVKYFRTLITQLSYWPSLIRELRRADVVHVFSASYFSFLLAPMPATLIARALGRPILLNYRSGEAPDHLRRSAIARATLRGVDRNVVPSRFLQDVFARHNIDATVIPNIIDRDRFTFRLREPVQPRLLSTRNFESLYNVACTLRAFQRIQRQVPDATLTLVGGGSEEGRLRALVHELGLKRVTFAGRVAPQDIWRFYGDHDIYVQTPDIDNMPSSVLEAFASGLPVVSTEAGGVPAMVTDGVHGLLAPLNDDAKIAEQVMRLLDDQALARRLVLAAFAATDPLVWDRVRDQWVTVYRGLLPQSISLAKARDRGEAPDVIHP
jgi:L-malate glycosyltransferase